MRGLEEADGQEKVRRRRVDYKKKMMRLLIMGGVEWALCVALLGSAVLGMEGVMQGLAIRYDNELVSMTEASVAEVPADFLGRDFCNRTPLDAYPASSDRTRGFQPTRTH